MPYKCTACDKSFRYKVSQRTHKCAAQPPGTVVRQAGDLVQKLIRQNVANQSGQVLSTISPPNALNMNSTNPAYEHMDHIDHQSSTCVNLHLEYPMPQAQNLDQTHNLCPTTHTSLDPTNTSHLTPFIHSDQTLDEFVEESYNNLGIAMASVDISTETAPKCQPDASAAAGLMNALDEIQIPSPSDKFQNLCLYSPQTSPATATAASTTVADDLFAQTLETINEDSFKQLLYENIDDLNLNLNHII